MQQYVMLIYLVKTRPRSPQFLAYAYTKKQPLTLLEQVMLLTVLAFDFNPFVI